MSAALRVQLLGPLQVERDGQPVALGGRAQRALLARLLLEPGRTVPVSRLVEDLWGENAPASASKMIQIYVSMLRKVLPEGVLVTRSPGYAVELPREAIDLSRFEDLRQAGQAALAAGSPAHALEQLREALALWHGAALAEFEEPFATIDRTGSRRCHLATVEDRIDAELRARPRTARSSPSCTRSSPAIRCASGCAASSCWRCTGPGARPTRSPSTTGCATCSSTASASTPRRPSASWSAASCNRTRRS